MCGIAGKVSFAGAPVDPAWLHEACDLVAHRGPDGERVFIDGGPGRPSVGLGHRRLKIIDLKPTADQPMHNTECVAAGSASPLAVVFNGEIYNYRDLRRDLRNRGHRLTTDSDTEVILHLYEECGPACVEALHGMFAFALWDARKEQLLLARDRVGKKPLYYRFDNRSAWFASEARAILADPEVPIEVDAQAVRQYLALGYVAGPGSAFSGLQRLPPAHRAVVDKTGVHLDRYWSLDYEPKRDVTEASAVEEIRHRLHASVKARLVSDVPLGAFLSGGIDSSAVVALMCREAGARVKTFSIGFEDASFNELEYARLVATRYDTEHHEFVVRPELVEVVPKLAWHYGEPYADSSSIPTYHLAKLAREHITVALTGDGGDESFAGYRRYTALRLRASYGRLPSGLKRAIAAAGRAVPAGGHAKSRLYDLGRLLRTAAQPIGPAYASWFGFFEPDTPILDPDFARSTSGVTALAPFGDAFDRHRLLDPIDQGMAADVGVYLPDDLLVKVDIATMAVGLEARSPFLDHELMAYAARLPASIKLPGRTTKALLKRAVSGLVPDEILSRRKTGFAVPLDSWLRGPLRGMLNDVLLSGQTRTRAYLNTAAVERLIAEHMSGRISHGHRLWALLMLELWHTSALERARNARRTAA